MRAVIYFVLMGLNVAALASAQPNTISTIAGGGPVNGPALSINVGNPQGVAVTPNGDVYFAATGLNAVYKLSDGVVILIAGTPGGAGFSGDDGPATSASLSSPWGVAVDGSGNLYIADAGNSRIRKVSTTTGVITTLAGNGNASYGGDGGPATSASLYDPHGVAVDRGGNVYIADFVTNRIRKVSAETGVITTVAGGGSGSSGFNGDGGPATSASLNYPSGVAVDGSGNLYIADNVYFVTGGSRGSNRIRKVSADTGVITTVAGNGSSGFSGDGGPATSASLYFPSGVAVGGSGNLYIVDSGNQRIREVFATTGIITTVAGNGSGSFSGDNGPATSAGLTLPSGVAVDGSGNLYIADAGNKRIRKVSAITGVITTVAGGGSGADIGDGGPATSASVHPGGVAVDGSGNVYIADTSNQRIRKVSAETGVIATVAGNGDHGFSGDGGPATTASLYYPNGVAVDGSGNLYIADAGNKRIRKVSAITGVITTVAGGGSGADIGDGGPATSASLYYPNGVAVDGSGNVYIADGYPYPRDELTNRIRKVSADTGVITTVAGNGFCCYYSGDGGPATSASLYSPNGVAVDGSGNLYIAEPFTVRIRKVSAETGVITTVAGNGFCCYSGDGGPATSASLYTPNGVAVDGMGNVYIADTQNNRIRKVSAVTGVITTVAGNDSYGFSGDGGPATSATLNYPLGVAVDGIGNVYIADSGNNRIRKVEHAISTTTLLSSNANPTTTQNLVVTATVSPSDASGSVQFFDGTTALQSAALSAGTATLSGPLLGAGIHSLVAVYSGDTNYAMSTSAALLQVVSSRAISTITLTSDGQPTQSDGQTVYVSMLNSPATFTATLAPVAASGTVQFFDGPMSLGVQAVSGGIAAFTTSSLALGNHTITAVYSGDVFFMPKWAAPLRQQVQIAAFGSSVNTRLSSR